MITKIKNMRPHEKFHDFLFYIHIQLTTGWPIFDMMIIDGIEKSIFPYDDIEHFTNRDIFYIKLFYPVFMKIHGFIEWIAFIVPGYCSECQ